jgi:hypothetical protein
MHKEVGAADRTIAGSGGSPQVVLDRHVVIAPPVLVRVQGGRHQQGERTETVRGTW